MLHKVSLLLIDGSTFPDNLYLISGIPQAYFNFVSMLKVIQN